MRNTIVPSAVATLAVLAFALPAKAALLIAGNVGGTTFFCADNDVSCDQNNQIGILELADQAINGVQVNGSIQTSVKGSVNSLDASSLSVINTNPTATAITVTVGDTNFTGPVTEWISSGSGTFTGAIAGSTVTYNYFNDPGNAQGGEAFNDTPGTQVDTFTATQTLARSQSFSHDDAGAITDGALFSMTISADGVLEAGASLLSRGESLIKPQAAVVPEPGSLALLGAALVGFVAIRRQSLCA